MVKVESGSAAAAASAAGTPAGSSEAWAMLSTHRAPPLEPRAFAQICDLVYRRAGIRLGPGKEALVVSRLTRKLREAGCRSFQDYARLAETNTDTLAAMVEALTTNYTAFFREPAHFDYLRDVILPDQAQRPGFHIWCAAAATGEEPYSLAFTLMEALGPGVVSRGKILATDISTQALATARRAIYPAAAFSSMPGDWMPKYLLRGEGRNSGQFKVKPEVARLIEFKPLNLMEDFEHSGLFTLISCRNVMIYFDRKTQERLVNRMARSLEPGGHLFVGHSESLTGIAHSLQFVRPAVYRAAGQTGRRGTVSACR
jgi:chemotaxis protein methyltransferase CheR